jgi:hypothetical protein
MSRSVGSRGVRVCVCVLTCYPNITVHCCLLLFVNIDTPLPQCFASCWHGVQQLRVGCLLETWEIRGRPVTEWFALSRSRKRGRQIILVGTAFLPLFCCPHVRFYSLSLHPHRWIAARNALQFGACRVIQCTNRIPRSRSAPSYG